MKSFLDPERRAELQQRWDEIERLLSEQFDCKPCGSDPHFIEGQLLQEQAAIEAELNAGVRCG